MLIPEWVWTWQFYVLIGVIVAIVTATVGQLLGDKDGEAAGMGIFLGVIWPLALGIASVVGGVASIFFSLKYAGIGLANLIKYLGYTPPCPKKEKS